MRERDNRFEDISTAAIERARSEGISDPIELRKIGESAKRQEIYRIGRESEQRYKNYVLKVKHFRYTLEATHEEDMDEGIDFWLGHEDDMKLPDLPVQIKSSDKDVEAFRSDRRYLKRDGVMLVFNTGPSVTKEDFKNQYRREISRVKSLLRNKNVHVY